MADPKKGTGKKPKGSGRRLYTDENPRDTVRIKWNNGLKLWVRARLRLLLRKEKMQLENVINRLLKFINTRLQALSMTVTSGSVDTMENYKYIIGQINGLEATKQELSNLLEDKEQNGKGTVIDINTKQ
jgi:hypothetical protein